MHEINIHTQRSDKYENKLGSDNRMKNNFPMEISTNSLVDHISNVGVELYHKVIWLQPQIMVYNSLISRT